MNISLFLAVFALLGIIYLIIGVRSAKGIATTDDYFLAGRGLGLWPLTATLVATHIGGGLILGAAQEAYIVGMYGVLYACGLALGFLVLGCGFASKYRSFNVSTTAELFETKYGSRFLRQFVSLISIISLCGIFAGQVVASRGIFYSLGAQNEILFIVFWLFIILYTMLGGLKAVVATDIFQVLLIIAIFGATFIYFIFGGSPLGVRDVVGSAANFSSEHMNFSRLLGFFLMPFLLTFVEQDLAQRFFAAKTRTIATLSAIFSGLIVIAFSCIPVYFGMLTRLLNLNMVAGGNPLITFYEWATGDLVVVLMVCGLFAAITSTADSLLCAITSHIALDFEFLFSRVKNKIFVSQVTTFVVGATGMFIAYFFTSVLELFKHSYELVVGTAFVSVFACFFLKRLVANAAMLSVIYGVLGFVIVRMGPNNFIPSFIPRELLTLLFSFVGYLIGYFFDSKIESQKL